MKKWLISASVLLLAGVAAFYYVMNKPHRSVMDEKGVTVTAESLFQSFQENETAANEKFLNKVLEVGGKVKSTETNTDSRTVIVLETSDPMFGINCTLESEARVKEGDEVVIKGICTGYLADVVINQGILINPGTK